MTVPGSLYTPTIRKTRASAYLLEQSLLFNDDDSAYLNRTPSVAGNRKTWTYSVWLKPTSDAVVFFQAGVDSSNWTQLVFSSGKLYLQHQDAGGGLESNLNTDAVFRDYSAWYHIVFSVDTTLATAADRIKIYVNGIQQTLTITTQISQNVDTFINSTNIHRISSHFSGAYYDGLMALPILVDGAALAPTSFGETDTDGFWNPIEFTGADTVVSFVDGSGLTKIGNMTTGGGLATAFNGNTSLTSSAGAGLNGVTEAFCGVDHGSGNTKSITEVHLWSSNNYGFEGSGSGTETHTVEFELQGSSDNFASDVNVLGTQSIAESGSGQLQVAMTGGDITSTTAYRYHRIRFNVSDDSSQGFYVSEIQLYEAGTGFGTNGGAYDFADNTDYGREAGYLYTSATDSSASLFRDEGSAFSFSGRDITNVTVNRAMSGEDASNLTGDFSVSWRTGPTMTAGGHYVVGFYDIAEDGTFSTGSQSGNLGAMTTSYRFQRGGEAIYSATTEATITNTTGDLMEMRRVGSAMTLYKNEVLVHTFTTGTSNTLRLVVAAGKTGNILKDVTIAYGDVVGNRYYANNFTASDQLPDVPTNDADEEIGNYTTLDPNNKASGVTLSNGNLTVSGGTPSTDRAAFSTIKLSSGKWYFEFKCNPNNNVGGWINSNYNLVTKDVEWNVADKWAVSYETATLMRTHLDGAYADRTISSFDATNDRYCIAVDLDNNYIWLGHYDDSAGTTAWVDGSGTFRTSDEPGLGTNPTDTMDSPPYQPFAGAKQTNLTTVNFGQQTFSGTVPDGFKELATQNLPDTHPLYTGTAAQYRAGTQIQTNAALGTNTSGSERNTTQRQEIAASIMADVDADWIRVKFAAHTSEGWGMDQAYVGEKASSGNAWDFDGNQVQLTFNGSVSVVVPAGSTMWSDWVALSTTGSINKIVSCNVTSDTSNDAMAREIGVTGYTRHNKASSDEAGTTAPTGYTSDATNLGYVKAIEVQ